MDQLNLDNALRNLAFVQQQKGISFEDFAKQVQAENNYGFTPEHLLNILKAFEAAKKIHKEIDDASTSSQRQAIIDAEDYAPLKSNIERVNGKRPIEVRNEGETRLTKKDSFVKKISQSRLYNKFVICLIVMAILLAVLNPSYNRFKEYSADVSTTKRKTICKRTFNGLVFSVYERQIVTLEEGEYAYSAPERFYGFCLNFFKKNS